MRRAIPVLTYHRIRSPVRDSRDVAPETFDAHMGYLRRRGWTPLVADELVDVLDGVRPWPRRPVAVTLDDGSLDLHRDAYPVLVRHGVPAIAFVITGRAEERSAGFVGWPELEELAASGLVDVQSHTHHHRRDNLRLLAAGRVGEIVDDLRRSRELIARRLGRPCRHLAWPQGHWNRALLELALAVGYRATFTTRCGANTADALPALHRFKVKERAVGWLATRLLIYSWALPATVYGALRGRRRSERWARGGAP